MDITHDLRSDLLQLPGLALYVSFPCMQSETKPEPDLKSPERGEQAKSQFILAF